MDGSSGGVYPQINHAGESTLVEAKKRPKYGHWLWEVLVRYGLAIALIAAGIGVIVGLRDVIERFGASPRA